MMPTHLPSTAAFGSTVQRPNAEEQMQNREEFTALLSAGTTSAAALCVLGLPLDVARHAAQAAISKKHPSPGFLEALRAASVPKSGLFRGFVPALCCSSLAPLAFLLPYEVQRGSTEVIQAGMVAKAVQVTAVQPFDFFRTIRQAVAMVPETQTTHLLRTPWQVMRSNGEGIRSMWRGFIPSLLRDVPAAGCYWWGYNSLSAALLKDLAEEEFDKNAMQQRAVTSAEISSVCAAAAALVTQPMDVVKTRMQIFCMKTHAKNGYTYYKVARVGKTLRETISIGGWRSLYVGTVARVASMALSGLLIGPLFEYAHLVNTDAERPLRQRLVLGEDPGRTIVHPRSTRDMFIDVKT